MIAEIVPSRKPLPLEGVLLACLLFPRVLVCAAGTTKAWPAYEGAWFRVEYPPEFKVILRERSSTVSEPKKYDGVSFVSPDGQVEFYVFSPQWIGDSEWVKLRRGERLTGRLKDETPKRKAYYGTIRGPHGKYSRCYEDLTDKGSNTRRVFGFKYLSRQAHEKHRAKYLMFKRSLVQYAD